MATAVQTSTEPRTPNPRVRLALASLLGALFVIAGVAVAGYLVPVLVERLLPRPEAGQADPLVFVRMATQIVLQVLVIGAWVWLGSALAGSNPPRGIRGGIFLAISVLITLFFVIRAVGLNTEGMEFGGPITAVVAGVLIGLGYKFLTSARAERWMHSLEEQGWFHTYAYKRTQGIRVRRYTLLGILLIGWSGVYTIVENETVGSGDWALVLPYTSTTAPPDPNWQNLTPDEARWAQAAREGNEVAGRERPLRLPVLTAVQYSVPLILAVLTFWIAWRAVNIPTFADFLIATEAEMNKVSWSSRRRLTQDTIVVLITVLMMTLFLFVTDYFWGTLLSWKYIGVLPSSTQTTRQTADPLEGKDIDW